MRILRIQIRKAQKHKAPANPDPAPDPDRQEWPEKSIHLSVSYSRQFALPSSHW